MLRIAIDGPAGAGKSTVARAVASRLGILHLDTGALYRALAYAALRRNIHPKDETAVGKLLGEVTVDVRLSGGEQRTFVNGEDVSGFIRTPEVGQGSSDISTLYEVRAAMTDLQRRIASRQPILLDGRDIGTHVLPDATYKFYLTATVEERAHRRMLEMNNSGILVSFEKVCEDVRARDLQDSTREHAPLRQADDARLIDTTDLSTEEVINTILCVINEGEDTAQ